MTSPLSIRALATMLGAVLFVGCSSPGPTPSPTTEVTPTPTPTSVPIHDLVPGYLEAQTEFSQPNVIASTPGQPIHVAATTTGAATFTAQDIGLSFEATDLTNPAWDPAQGTLDELLTQLGNPGLRFGGNSVDRRTFWTSTQEAAPEWAQVTLTPADFERLSRMVAVTGSSVTLALDLGHYDPARAADMAYHAHQALGDHLLAVTIGNEPNGFYDTRPPLQIRDASWNATTYVEQARAYVTAIHQRVPDLAIIGPGAFDAPWWRAFIQADLDNTIALTQHWYPLWSCDGAKEPRAQPTASNLVSPWIHERADFILGMGEQTAAAAALPLWLEETGPTSCGGENDAADTHAQALWTVDYTLNAVQHGITRINHHSMLGACAGGAPMSIVCTNQETRRLNGRAAYLGLALLSQIPHDSHGGQIEATGGATAYAFRNDTDLHVIVVNPADPRTVGRSSLTVDVPQGAVLTEVSQLNGTDLTDATTTTFIPLSASSHALEALNPASATLLHYRLA